MPRLSYSSDYLLSSPSRSIESSIYRFDPYSRSFTSCDRNEPTSPIVSPKEIDQILSRKLYEQLKTTTTPSSNDSQRVVSSSKYPIDPELISLIDRFFRLTYLNTVPMVNLLATAVATNFLKENIRELDRKFQEEQAIQMSSAIKRGTSLLFPSDQIDDDDDDDDLSWASAPT